MQALVVGRDVDGRDAETARRAIEEYKATHRRSIEVNKAKRVAARRRASRAIQLARQQRLQLHYAETQSELNQSQSAAHRALASHRAALGDGSSMEDDDEDLVNDARARQLSLAAGRSGMPAPPLAHVPMPRVSQTRRKEHSEEESPRKGQEAYRRKREWRAGGFDFRKARADAWDVLVDSLHKAPLA